MFELELIELLNKYKKSDTYEKGKIKKSITNLISQNKEQYEKFLNTQAIDAQTKQFLTQCEQEISQEKDETKSDLEIIKNQYSKWLEIYEQNNRIPNQDNEKIILSLINFYAPNRFQILEQILQIKDTQDYEDFKNMLKNYLRKYFAEKIEQYYQSEAYKSLGFFAKRKKKDQIIKTIDNLGKYIFNPKEIEEATQ